MKLSDFKNKYGLSGLWSQPTGYMEYEDRTEEVIKDVKSILLDIIYQLPGETQQNKECLQKVRDIITNLLT